MPLYILAQVLHPGLVHQVQMDLFLMKMGSHIIGLLPGFKWLSLTEIVEEFEKLMIQQVCGMSACVEMKTPSVLLLAGYNFILFKGLNEGLLACSLFMVFVLISHIMLLK